MTRSLFLVFTFLLSQSCFAQQFDLILNGKKLSNGSFVPIRDFQNIKVKTPKGYKGKKENLELRFVFIPFGDTLRSFAQPISDMKNVGLEKKLEVIRLDPENISHVLLLVTENEIQYGTISVSTRKLTTAEDYFNEFKRNAYHGMMNEAVSHITQAINLDPKNIEYNNAFGQLFFEFERFQEAKEVFQVVCREVPNYLAFAYLGAIYIKEKDWENAKSSFNEALLLTANPADISYVYFSFGEIEDASYNYSGAYDFYKKSLDQDPKNKLALNNISIVCSKVGKSEEKIGYLKRIIEIDSTFIPARINIGFQLLKENKFEEALKEFNYVIDKEPKNALAINNKSFALYKLNLLDEALQMVNQSIALDPSNSFAYKNRALIYIQQGKTELACSDLSKALELNFTLDYGDEVERLMAEHCKNIKFY